MYFNLSDFIFDFGEQVCEMIVSLVLAPTGICFHYLRIIIAEFRSICVIVQNACLFRHPFTTNQKGQTR